MVLICTGNCGVKKLAEETIGAREILERARPPVIRANKIVNKEKLKRSDNRRFKK